jgi:hypothetical protein
MALYRDDIIPLCRELVTDNPNDSRARTDLIKALQEYGRRLVDTGQFGQAIRPLSEAATGWNQEYDRTHDLISSRSLALTELILARAWLGTGDAAAARPAAARSIEISTESMRQWPEAEVFSELLQESKTLRNRILEELGSIRP